MKRIIFVDDDPNIRNGLKRVLFSMHLDWSIEFAENGSQALELMEQKNFDAIVCDMRMPGISGLQVLDIVSQKYPKTIRFVLSGMVDLETSLNVTKYAHQFFTKPCEAKTIIEALQRAFSFGGILYNGELKELISKLKNLPSLPSLYTQITAEIQSPQASLDKIGAIVKQDPSMSAKILQLVNSAFFGIKQNIVDPIQATTFLGVDVIRDLALSIQLFSQFDTHLLEKLNITAIWDHSTRVAIFARNIEILERSNGFESSHVFTAGILHDIGKLVLIQNFPKKYYSVLETVRQGNSTLFEAEKNIFGTTHSHIGAYLLGLWGLPNPIIEGVAYHHIPQENPEQKLSTTTIIYVANYLAHKFYPKSWTPKNQRLEMEYLETIGMADRYTVWEKNCLDSV